jgi:hypothetical protein
VTDGPAIPFESDSVQNFVAFPTKRDQLACVVTKGTASPDVVHIKVHDSSPLAGVSGHGTSAGVMDICL